MRAWAFCRSLLITALMGGLASATLVRMAPGFDEDERELDPRLSEASRQAIRDSRVADRNLLKFYPRYLGGLLRGEFGVSHSLHRPVAELLAERSPVTFRLAAWGLIAGWILGLGLALAASSKSLRLDLFSSSLCGLLFCLPAAVIGVLALFAGAAPWWAIALAVLPKVFTYARNLLEKVYAAPHVLVARAKGLSTGRILLWHVIPSMAPEMLALAGVTVSLAFSAAIPIEAVCDVPGLGQLAWQAALGRDLPVLVTFTLLLAIVTRAGSAAADLATQAVRPEGS